MNTTPTEPPVGAGIEQHTLSLFGEPFSRRALAGGAAAVAGVSLVAGSPGSSGLAAAATGTRVPDVLGSVSTAPHLPTGFAKTFKSRFINANGLRQHVVIGGDGPPLLLVHGWPENWYAWRHVMPKLARDFTVIAVDQRGIGLTGKPVQGSYDAGTCARDLAALMTVLGHDRFAVVGHDTGMVISYALAADYPTRVDRVALAEVPGPPTVEHSPPMFIDRAHNDRLWHIPFNRAGRIAEQLVKGNEEIFYGYEFEIQGGKPLPGYALNYYVRLLSRGHRARHGSFGFYRGWDKTQAQNAKRGAVKLPMPVLGIGGADSWGPAVGGALQGVAVDVQTAVIEGAGHWVAEQAPVELVSTLRGFLAPYRDAASRSR